MGSSNYYYCDQQSTRTTLNWWSLGNQSDSIPVPYNIIFNISELNVHDCIRVLENIENSNFLSWTDFSWMTIDDQEAVGRYFVRVRDSPVVCIRDPSGVRTRDRQGWQRSLNVQTTEFLLRNLHPYFEKLNGHHPFSLVISVSHPI